MAPEDIHFKHNIWSYKKYTQWMIIWHEALNYVNALISNCVSCGADLPARYSMTAAM